MLGKWTVGNGIIIDITAAKNVHVLEASIILIEGNKFKEKIVRNANICNHNYNRYLPQPSEFWPEQTSQINEEIDGQPTFL